MFIIGRIIKYFFGKKVYAFIGSSGTGKSFRAKIVAEKYSIKLIIDDGLLIYKDKIIAGKSAKKETSFFNAVRTAIFDDLSHRQEIINALADIKFTSILILGTSEKMISRICERLNLEMPFKTIYIQDVASKKEIETALENRKMGKHIIPVSTIEIEKKHPSLLFNSIKIFFKDNLLTRKKMVEKTVVQPNYYEIEKKYKNNTKKE